MPQGGTNEQLPDMARDAMLTRIPTAARDETVAAVRKRVLDRKAGWDTLNYVYILDGKDRLVGVLSIRELIEASPRDRMEMFVRKDLHAVRRHSPLPLAASRAINHNIKMVPVLDAKRRLLGVVGTDAIMDILEAEHVRDVLTASGITTERDNFRDVLSARIRDMVKWRTPWLVIGVFGGMLSSSIVEGFGAQLDALVELAFFIPVILYMGAAVGGQAQMLYVRGVSYQTVEMRPYLWREFAVDAIVGLFLAATIGAYAYWATSLLVAAIVATSIFLITASAGFIAVTISALFIKLKQDPAMGGGPFATIAQDIASLMIYLTIASLFLL